AYGEFIALPPRLVASNVVPLGRALPTARAAFAEPLACALHGIERARVESGQTVVVFGLGPLGCLLGMAAAARKARVILVGQSGVLAPDSLITHRMRLDAVRQALNLMARGDALKVLIEPWADDRGCSPGPRSSS